jgi:hypothetical protein
MDAERGGGGEVRRTAPPTLDGGSDDNAKKVATAIHDIEEAWKRLGDQLPRPEALASPWPEAGLRPTIKGGPQRKPFSSTDPRRNRRSKPVLGRKGLHKKISTLFNDRYAPQSAAKVNPGAATPLPGTGLRAQPIAPQRELTRPPPPRQIHERRLARRPAHLCTGATAWRRVQLVREGGTRRVQLVREGGEPPRDPTSFSGMQNAAPKAPCRGWQPPLPRQPAGQNARVAGDGGAGAAGAARAGP